MKEHILIRKIGFGWVECSHQWSREGYHYSSQELLAHLTNMVIPFEIKRGIPSQVPNNNNRVFNKVQTQDRVSTRFQE